MMKILLVCTGNSCRSQMAHGYLAKMLPASNIYSAGSHPSSVNPKSIIVMKDEGIDISLHQSNGMDEYLDIPFDYVITLCDNAQKLCPIYPGDGQMIHHSLPDPYGQDVSEYLRVRELIKEYCQSFVETLK